MTAMSEQAAAEDKKRAASALAAIGWMAGSVFLFSILDATV